MGGAFALAQEMPFEASSVAWAVLVAATLLWAATVARQVLASRLKAAKGALPESEWKGLVNLGRHAGVASIQGRRNHMEDTYMAVVNLGSDAQSAFFAVFDGHGGHRASAFAARYLHERILELDYRRNPKDAIRDGLAALDRDWLSLAEVSGWDDGTTVIMCLIQDGHVYVGNVGDSRAVLAHRGEAVAMSADHKPDRPDEKRRVEALGGRIVFYGTWRVEGQLAVTRAVGDRRLKRYVSSEPEVRKRRIDKDDQFLVLASDGLYDVMGNQDAVDIVYQSTGVIEAARNLTKAAYVRNSLDNITSLVVDLRAFRADSAAGADAAS